jgi:mycofactocin precursor
MERTKEAMQVASDAIVDVAVIEGVVAMEDPEELLVEEVSIDGLCGVY